MFKKIKKYILIAAMMGVMIPAGIVNAASVKELNVRYNDGHINVDGEAPDAQAVMILVYNEKETKLVASKSTETSSSGYFVESLNVPTLGKKEKYVVKAADYAGGTFKKVTINKSGTVKSDDDEDEDEDEDDEYTITNSLSDAKLAPQTGER